MNNKELEDFIKSEITPTASFNIVLNAVKAALEAGVYDSIDQAVIKKALHTLKEKSDAGKNFMIKVK